MDGARAADLLAAVAGRRDRQAFAMLFEYYAPRIKTYMRRSGASDTAAEELAQETLLTVWRRAETFDGSRTGASAWIFTIARNQRIDALRRDRRGPMIDLASLPEGDQPVDDAPHPDAAMTASQHEDRIRAALEQLPEDQRKVVELSFYQDSAHAEIAQQLRIPLGTVKSRLRLAMGRLRGLLGDLT